MAEEKRKVAPTVTSYVDDNHETLTIEVSLPGVAKKDIRVRMHDDSFNLTAARDDLEYVTTLSFCCPVSPEKAHAEYNNGLLRITAPFRDVMEGAVEVSVS
jgi:HSP20 family molecular chaperone IbpA